MSDEQFHCPHCNRWKKIELRRDHLHPTNRNKYTCVDCELRVQESMKVSEKKKLRIRKANMKREIYIPKEK